MTARFAARALGALVASAALAQAPTPTGRGAMAVKPVVCRTVEEGRGKAGQELADAVETFAARFDRDNYTLAALLPGEPPIACFVSRADSTKLPRGAR
jgi:hypothetical protein